MKELSSCALLSPEECQQRVLQLQAKMLQVHLHPSPFTLHPSSPFIFSLHFFPPLLTILKLLEPSLATTTKTLAESDGTHEYNEEPWEETTEAEIWKENEARLIELYEFLRSPQLSHFISFSNTFFSVFILRK
ncbi:hypothetical protein M1146_08130 [Patescibacteria group bacterium]|nr:hypothetical protein [Patescibacteria group bacterium]